MPEATMILLDNSYFSINGDYEPTRWMTEIEAAGLIIQTKLQQHRQNLVAIGLTAGNLSEIICTLTNDVVKASSFLYGIKQYGQQKIVLSLQIAMLALKHKSNPTLLQRIVCFVASTIQESQDQLRLICKKLKKNNIILDLIAIGDLSGTQREKLQLMHELIQSDNKSELIFVEPDTNLSDILFSGKILVAQPKIIAQDADPEFLLALRLSLLEEQERANQIIQGAMVSNQELEQRAQQMAGEEPQGNEEQNSRSSQE